MRVAVFNGPGKPITIESMPDPEPEPNEVLVRVCRCGICGSDVSMTGDVPITFVPGRRFGHEYSGEIVDVGRQVTSFKVGDRVACLPAVRCGRCDGCRNGNPLLCTAPKAVDGGFGEYIAVPPEAARRLPNILSLADGALIEPMACGLHALRLARMQPDARILVLGAGAMALSVIYWARLLGARRIVAVSRSAHRNDMALGLGADAVLKFGADDSEAFVEALGGPPDIVAECVGKEGMLNKAIDHARSQGIVISMGMCMQNEPILAARCTFKEVSVLFPLGYTPDEFVETARAFESGRVRPELMVSDVIALEDLPATLESLRAGRKSLKIHVDPSLRTAHA